MSQTKERVRTQAAVRGADRDPLGHLTKDQRAVVTHTDGPLLVVAGAGTGKTRVLVERIVWLITVRGVPPQHILALTFTEKAAAELQNRVDDALTISAMTPWIGTFHGFCEYVLRDEARSIGLDPRFRILSPPEVWLGLKRNLFQLPLSLYRPLGNPTKFVQDLAEFFSLVKDHGITPENLERYATRAIEQHHETGPEGRGQDEAAQWRELAEVYRAYIASQRAEGVMDFGDLQVETVRLFREHQGVLGRIRDRFPHILVDEFQDTNALQCTLIEFLAGPLGDLVVVSDDDQAIFAFRGSNIANVLTFRERFLGSTLVSLRENFRSPQALLDRAYELIQRNNPHRLEDMVGISKRLKSQTARRSTAKMDTPISHRHFGTEESELSWVAEEILRLVDGGAAYRDIAILTRTNAQAAEIVPLLLRRDIPHTITESQGLLARPEVKDILAYLRLLCDPTDGRSLFRILTHPALSVPAADRATILAKLQITRGAVLPLLRDAALRAQLTKESLTGVRRLTELLERHLTAFRTLRPSLAALEFLERSGILRHAVQGSAEHPEILPNLEALLTYIRDLERGAEGDILEFLDLLDAAIEGRAGPPSAGLPTDADAVRILTVHAAKGLEFPHVFITGATADRYPSRGRGKPLEIPSDLVPQNASLPRLDDREAHVLEERRLFYVALTRAQTRLVITSATSAAGVKSRRKPSPFITEARIHSREVSADSSLREQQLTLPITSAPRPKTPADGSLTTSASKIVQFETCPLKYKFRYVLNVPTQPHHALSFGSTVHKVLSGLGSAVARGEHPGVTDALTLYDAYWMSEGYESADHEAARKAAGRHTLTTYLTTHGELLTRAPVAVEIPFSLRLPTTKLTGRIDRIERTSDGHIIVTDFKTGTGHAAKRQRAPERHPVESAERIRRGHLAGKGSEADADVQLSIYALAMRQALRLNPDRLTLSYVEENLESTTTRTPDDDAQTAARVENVATRIRAGEFTATPGYHCRFCDFRQICDFAESR